MAFSTITYALAQPSILALATALLEGVSGTVTVVAEGQPASLRINISTTPPTLILSLPAGVGGGTVDPPVDPTDPGDLDPGTPGAVTLAFESGRASGANPVYMTVQTLSIAPNDVLQIRSATTENGLTSASWEDVGVLVTEESEFTASSVPAGLRYFQARVKRVEDKGGNTIAARYSDPSNIISDTLNSAVVTPPPTPTTFWSTTGKGASIELSNDNRTARQAYGGAGDQFVFSETAGGIGKKVALTVRAGTSPPNSFGIVLNTGQGNGTQLLFLHFSGFADPGGSGPTMAVGDVIELELVANQTIASNIDVLVRKNAGAATRFVLNSSVPLYYGGYFNDETSALEITDFTHWN